MHRVALRRDCRIDEHFAVDIAALGRGRTDAERGVGERDAAQVTIGLGVDGNRLQTLLGTGPHDAQRDFAAIGDENLFHDRPSPRGRNTGSTMPSRNDWNVTSTGMLHFTASGAQSTTWLRIVTPSSSRTRPTT